MASGDENVVALEPRRAKPGTVFTITGPDGEQIDMTADDEGVVRPETPAHAAGLDLFGLPVARKAMADADLNAADEPIKEIDGNAKPKGGK